MSCFWDGQNIRYASTFCSASGTSYDINDLLNNEPVPVTEPFGETDFAATADGASPGLSSSDSVGNVTGLIDLNNGALVTFKGCDKSIAVPEGWEEGAPPLEGWVQGYNAFANMGQHTTPCGTLAAKGLVYYPTVGQALAAAIAHSEEGIALYMICQGQSTYQTIVTGAEPNQYVLLQQKAGAFFETRSSFQVGGPYGCAPTEGSASCPIEAPTLTDWPSDGTYEIIMSGGKFYASNDDPDAPQTLKDGTTTLNFTGGITWTANSDGTYTITDGVNTQTIRCDGSRAS